MAARPAQRPEILICELVSAAKRHMPKIQRFPRFFALSSKAQAIEGKVLSGCVQLARKRIQKHSPCMLVRGRVPFRGFRACAHVRRIAHLALTCQIQVEKATTGNIKLLPFFAPPVWQQGAQYNVGALGRKTLV